MQLALLEVLRCPACSASLAAAGADDGRLDHGSLACSACGRRYDVEDGIPRMLHDDLLGIEAKRREIAGWAELARQQGWYEPDDAIDARLPFLSELGWEDATWRANEHSFSLLLDRYVRPGMRVLEVGAAKCWGAQHLLARGCEYVGSDILADAKIGLGRGSFYEGLVGRPFDRVQADGERLPFADDAFDLTYCVASLHHALDLGAMVGEMARVTRRGGIVAALNEGTRPLGVGGDNPDQQEEIALGINEHVHTLPAYLWGFARAGLVPLRVERSDGYGMFAGRTKIQKLMRLPFGRTALTGYCSLRKGYSGISIYARRVRP